MLMISQVTRKMMVNIFKCGSNHTETIRVICMQSFGSMHERFGYVRKFNFNTNAFHLGSKVYWLNKRIIHLNVSVVNYIKTIVMNIYEKNKNNIYSIRCFIVKASGVNCRRVILNKVSFSINLWEKIRPKSLTLLARISTALILSLTIYLTLLKEGIEHQPGPPNSKITLSILTYNCNGLGDSKKLKRVIMKSRRLVERGCIVMLQETHLVDTKYLDLIWKHNYLSNCMRTNSAGVIILFNKQYNLVNKIVDNDGRQIIAVVESDDNKIILVNAYFPNDHRQGVAFAENIYTKILEMQNKYPEYVTFFAGDMNICMSSNDSLNRIGSRNEDLVSDVIKNSNEIAELTDAYRLLNPEGGFTWRRGTIYSRLDYVFVSNSVTNKISEATVDWAFETSDHAALKIDFKLDNVPERGPGIIKVNTKILEDPVIALQVGTEIEEMMKQTDDSWNPHAKLEFLKVAIRSVTSAKVSELRKVANEDIKETEEELNQMEDLRIKLLSKSNVTINESSTRLNMIDKSVTCLKSKLLRLRSRLSSTMNFTSRAKWFEYGEKSNKFFLNLTKARQNQKLISRIKDGNQTYEGQDQVSRGITNFYRKLYSSKPTEQTHNDDFYKNCPKLSEDQKQLLDKELNLTELREALSTCKESSPGPDGIPYAIYKKYWKLTGPIILKAWQYSVEKGILPNSHLESVITLLPKEGKDTGDIKNWRPITLSNCDSKIITKAISMKTSKVLESIIDHSQTAYVPGRSVSDNLRSNFFLKRQCRKKNIDAVLISLDAKKAFDSVNHKYIEDTLTAYGFGPIFIQNFKILYRNITARILVNGFTSESIKIERGVKQGDALSCAIFIICIDPLLRNLNRNTRIKEIQIGRRSEMGGDIFFKGSAYADDISVVCKKSKDCIQQVFYEYERLTKRSGLELNADKTEILNLNSEEKDQIAFSYNGDTFAINAVEKIKICGLYYSMNLQEEYQLNVIEKINKLCYKIKLWSHRHLTMEGKVLIVKTFGLSQIIYNMQSYGFEKDEILSIEKSIFRFLWSTSDNPNGIDRIKRSIMKNDYMKGGMKVTDVECLDRSLKLKQFIRAKNSNHVIATIQSLITSKSRKPILQEYPRLTEEETICRSAQETLNILIDYNRETYKSILEEEYEIDKNLIEEVSSINVKNYLKRKNKMFMLCMSNTLTKNGIITLGELTQAYEYEADIKLSKIMKMIMSTFPESLINISKCFNEEINSNCEEMKYMQIAPGIRKDITIITAKELQVLLKNALGRIESLNVNNKLGIQNYDEENISKFRTNCKNSKLRNIYFRLIHNDFYTRVRMKKFGMTNNEDCPRCGEIETSEHLLWNCAHVKNIWSLFNQIMCQVSLHNECVTLYEDVFRVGSHPANCMIKIKIIQALIQIERPTYWNRQNILDIINDLRKVEKYNSSITRTIDKFKIKWNLFESLT